ncbi:hypothetical protein PpBr36_02163 [Pyricularia pennisetigena]|uniref:hypothetical protein n=1 Tax=Pyricularia pennisetigena TaxID=1578925 RepID=UPI001154A1C3|nr:hypothetical protein PpBr36_02163 [Pyricularia pennisetigena]TLS28215.1 hypothetical protein PpBr36_02163 [Pyricularia pennisetigena]
MLGHLSNPALILETLSNVSLPFGHQPLPRIGTPSLDEVPPIIRPQVGHDPTPPRREAPMHGDDGPGDVGTVDQMHSALAPDGVLGAGDTGDPVARVACLAVVQPREV